MAFSWNVATDLICSDVPTLSQMTDICFPGGACLSHMSSAINSIPSPSEIPLEYLSQLGPATSFMQPLMNVLDTVLAIFKCMEAFTDFATSLDPSEIFKCFPDLIDKVNSILTMIPQMSIPRMVISIIESMISLLRGLAIDLQYIVDRLNDITTEIDRAADLGDVTKSGFLACAENTMQDSLTATSVALKAVGRIILLVNIFMGLFGGPEIPCFGELLDGVAADALAPIIDTLNALADLLQQLLDMIPDPQAAITKALGETRC